jgi:hypothetical protein
MQLGSHIYNPVFSSFFFFRVHGFLLVLDVFLPSSFFDCFPHHLSSSLSRRKWSEIGEVTAVCSAEHVALHIDPFYA